ncbi:hypothetical protein AOLI_G00238700 [Acnodon oligacanthus]
MTAFDQQVSLKRCFSSLKAVVSSSASAAFTSVTGEVALLGSDDSPAFTTTEIKSERYIMTQLANRPPAAVLF